MCRAVECTHPGKNQHFLVFVSTPKSANPYTHLHFDGILWPVATAAQIKTNPHQKFPLEMVLVRFKNRSRLSLVCFDCVTSYKLDFIQTQLIGSEYWLHSIGSNAVAQLFYRLQTHNTFTSLHKHSIQSGCFRMSNGHSLQKLGTFFIFIGPKCQIFAGHVTCFCK